MDAGRQGNAEDCRSRFRMVALATNGLVIKELGHHCRPLHAGWESAYVTTKVT